MACDTIKIETLDADEVVSIVTQGPQGPSGAEAATLTTTGDLLYRAALANDRLPIGSEGQVLKVASGIPAWGNESGAVTSVNGETGAVVLDAADIGAAPATGIDPTAITGTAVVDNDARLSDSRTPTSHAASHASAGSDPLFDQDLNTTDAVTFNTINASVVQGSDLVIESSFEFKDIANGFSALLTAQDKLSANRNIDLPNGDGTIALVSDIPALGTGAGEAAEGDHGHGNINSSGQVGTTANLPLKTGTGGIVEAGAFGTGAGEFAEGNHTHTQLHDKSHSMTDATSHTAGNHKVFYSDGSGQIQELALGNSGEVLTSNGASAAPSFAAASGGGSSIMQSIAVGFVLN